MINLTCDRFPFLKYPGIQLTTVAMVTLKNLALFQLSLRRAKLNECVRSEFVSAEIHCTLCWVHTMDLEIHLAEIILSCRLHYYQYLKI